MAVNAPTPAAAPADTAVCAWCAAAPPVCFLFTVATCQSCLDGGRKHRVAVALKRWSKR